MLIDNLGIVNINRNPHLKFPSLEAQGFSRVLRQHQIAMQDARLRVNIDRPVAFRDFKIPRPRSVARYGDRTRSDVFRGVQICIVFVTALLTAETQAPPVRCRDVAASTTPTTCVAGTDCLHFDANRRSFVGDFKSHIGIRPAVDFGTEFFPLTQRSVSDIAEFFDHDFSCSDLNRVADQCLRGDMQEMPRYSSLAPGHPSQESSGASGANRLDSGAGAPDTRTTVIQPPAVEEKCLCIRRIAGNQHSIDAKITANDTTFGLGFWNLYLVNQAEKPLIADAFNLGVFPRAFRQWAGIGNGQKLTPKRDASLGTIKVPLPHHRNHGAGELSKPPTFVCLGGLVGSADGFAKGTSKLRGQPHFPEIGVVSFSQPVRVQLLGLEGNARKPICSFQPNSKQSVSFCAAGNPNLDCANCFHYTRYYHQEKAMSTQWL